MLPVPIQPAVVRRTEGSQAGHSLPLSPLCMSYWNHGCPSVASLCSGSEVTAGSWALSLRGHGGASRRPVPKVPGAAVTPVRHRAWHGRRLSSAVARSQHHCTPASTPASPCADSWVQTPTLGHRAGPWQALRMGSGSRGSLHVSPGHPPSGWEAYRSADLPRVAAATVGPR